MSLLSEAPKKQTYPFLVSVFITVLLLQSIFEVNKGVTGQCKINRTDNQPGPAWDESLFKLHGYEQSTYSEIGINTSPADTEEFPRRHTDILNLTMR